MSSFKNFIYFTNGLILLFCLFLIWDRAFQESQPDKSEQIIKYLDSIEQQNRILKFKIDSLDLLKKEQYNIYYKTKLKYDTIQINIDTMPNVDATKFLLSISRQLTVKGIE